MARAELSWLEDPEVFRVNRLDAHSDHRFYSTEADMEAKNETLLQSLNGQWDFSWSRCPSERPADFYKEDYDLSGFKTIEVPGHMELQGYGGIHYINTMYPWEGHAELRPPYIDWKDNPVGSYVRQFDLKDEWADKRICISFQGVEEAFYVWLNGILIGYAEDTFTPSDFDLTPYIRSKGNRLCVEVYKKSSASWIEDQDFFRFSGIFRDVFLYAKTKVHVEDMWVQSGLAEDNRTGILALSFKLSKQGLQGESIFLNRMDEENLTAELILNDLSGKTMWKSSLTHPDNGEDADGVFFKIEPVTLPNILPWSSEHPNMYQFILKLYDSDGHMIEAATNRTGFRRFEIKNKIMYLNGERLIINGVNRHEWNPRRGRAITAEDMRKDIEILKKNHINAVRTCHYPNQSLWYELCDENGIYMMDEANLESHGSWQKMGVCEPSWNVPGSLPQWERCVVDRAVSMVQRDKNHPSILWWSCGNESYAGTCILAMSRYFHEKDSSRLVHYEGVFWNRAFDEISDVESRMYAPPAEVRRYLKEEARKPYLLCEYMHDMGNSIGGMESYIRLFNEFPMYQGGFIWDYIDQAIYRNDVDGNEVLSYGGDFGDRPTDYAFSGNGIVFADRTEKPAMQEVRYWYSKEIERAALDEQNRKKAAEADLEIQNRRNNKINTKSGNGTAASKETEFEVIRGDVTLGVRGNGFHLIFSYSEHGPVSFVYDHKEWLYRAPKPAFWRASTENDKGNGFPLKSAVWMGADQFIFCTGWSVEDSIPNQVTIRYEYETCTNPKTSVTVAYTVMSDGMIRVDTQYKGKQGLPELPLFGIRFVLPEPVTQYKWLGPAGETYPDRWKGGTFGVHESEPDIPAYLVPQECGNHMNTRWMQVWSIDDEIKTGLEFIMDNQPFHFSVLPYTPQELENAMHREELPPVHRTIVTILAKMRGVGGIDSWGSDVESDYHISGEEDIEFSFFLRCPQR
ncbi:MAG: glycoside hydrolase family 2 TIM barrel-domain containing protein [Clostridium sp.]